jgi:hypothetical protein
MPLPKQWLADFQKLSPQDQHKYLLDTDTDYKSFSPQDQAAYRQYLGGAVVSPPSAATLASSKARNANPTQFEKDAATFRPSLEGVGSDLWRETKTGAGALAGIPSAIYHAIADQPTGRETKELPGTLGRAVLPIHRMVSEPIENASEWYSKAAQGKIPNAMDQALSVAPEAVGSATGNVVGSALGAKAGSAAAGLFNRNSPIPRETAANMIADAVLPNPKVRPQFVQDLTNHWDKITSYAQDRGIPLNSLKNLQQAMSGAGETLSNHFSNLVKPFRSEVMDPSNPTYTLGDMHDRLMTINNQLLPAYEKGLGGVDPTQAVKAQADLNTEAANLRGQIYPKLAELTGIPADQLQDLNGGGGALRNLAQRTQLGLSSTQNAAAKSGRAPVSISPWGGKKFILDKAANAGLTKLGMTTDPDTLVTNAFKNTPNYDYSPPGMPAVKGASPADALDSIPPKSSPPAAILGAIKNRKSNALGNIPVNTPPNSDALATASTPKSVPASREAEAANYVDLASPPSEDFYLNPEKGSPMAGFAQPAGPDLGDPNASRVPQMIQKALNPGQYEAPRSTLLDMPPSSIKQLPAAGRNNLPASSIPPKPFLPPGAAYPLPPSSLESAQ